MNAVFSTAAACGAWFFLTSAVGLGASWSTALSVLWAALIWEALRYDKKEDL